MVITLKTYVEFDAKSGYPRGPDLFYECQICRSLLPSMPSDNTDCLCFNIGMMSRRDEWP